MIMLSRSAIPLPLLFTAFLVVLLTVVRVEGRPAYAAVPDPAPAYAPEVRSSLADREANRFYRDCLARRDAGDMRCGESCFWRECITCANVCTLNCIETYDCG